MDEGLGGRDGREETQELEVRNSGKSTRARETSESGRRDRWMMVERGMHQSPCDRQQS